MACNLEKRFRFSIPRLLLSVAAVCVVLACTRDDKVVGYAVPLCAALAVGSVVLLAQRADVGRITNAAAWSLAGAFCLGPGCLLPRVGSAEYVAQQELHRAIGGAVVAWFIGCAVRQSRSLSRHHVERGKVIDGEAVDSDEF
jgi:hypothetical protein